MTITLDIGPVLASVLWLAVAVWAFSHAARVWHIK